MYCDFYCPLMGIVSNCTVTLVLWHLGSNVWGEGGGGEGCPQLLPPIVIIFIFLNVICCFFHQCIQLSLQTKTLRIQYLEVSVKDRKQNSIFVGSIYIHDVL